MMHARFRGKYSITVLPWHTDRYQIMHINIAFSMTEIVTYARPSTRNAKKFGAGRRGGPADQDPQG